MNEREKAIVTAYTGITMLQGEGLNAFYKYLDELFGRPVYTHEIPILADEIKKRSRDDFIALCRKTEPEQKWYRTIDRPPEENGQYIITVKYKHEDGYDDIYAEHGEWCDGKWDMFCLGHCGEVESIIAWMPLPEPYREEQNGQDA